MRKFLQFSFPYINVIFFMFKINIIYVLELAFFLRTTLLR